MLLFQKSYLIIHQTAVKQAFSHLISIFFSYFLFSLGDVIVGMKPVDRSWYHGRHGDMYGMFPVTHVRELETALPGEYMSPTDSEQGQGQGDSDQQVNYACEIVGISSSLACC